MDWNLKTIQTYDDSAPALADYFKGIGPRVDDIKLALRLAGKPKDARVIEIGCGDGRDAMEITKRVAWYEGFDPSKGLLKIAQSNLPRTSFVLADALSYHYPDNVDVIFAFASLLHINKEDLKLVLNKAAKSLRKDGIFYISLKERDEYTEEVKKDKYGERMFYLYTPTTVKDAAGKLFVAVQEDHKTLGDTRWFTIALKKI